MHCTESVYTNKHLFSSSTLLPQCIKNTEGEVHSEFCYIYCGNSARREGTLSKTFHFLTDTRITCGGMENKAS